MLSSCPQVLETSSGVFLLHLYCPLTICIYALVVFASDPSCCSLEIMQPSNAGHTFRAFSHLMSTLRLVDPMSSLRTVWCLTGTGSSTYGLALCLVHVDAFVHLTWEWVLVLFAVFLRSREEKDKNNNLEWLASKHHRHKWLTALFTFQYIRCWRKHSTIKPLGTHLASAFFSSRKWNQYTVRSCINMQFRRHLCWAQKSN